MFFRLFGNIAAAQCLVSICTLDGIMDRDPYEAAITAFIHSKGITRCPTACALPTQGTVSAVDRAALRSYAVARSQSRRQKIAARERFLSAFKISAVSDE
jgi:hypothetical protein